MKSALMKAGVVVGAPIVAVLTWASVSGATTYDPTTDATNAADSAGTLAGPVIAAVFAGIVGLLVLFWAISYIKRLFGRGR